MKMLLNFNSDEINFELLLNSPIIKQSSLKSYEKILSLHKYGTSKSALFLLLSQIESVLRLIYGQVNRVKMTAQLDKYYVIMDSIFYEYVLDDDCSPLVIGKINRKQELHISRNNRKNRMFEVFPISLMHLGYDLFQAIDGPRIRDKISHGESTVNNEDCILITQKLLQFVTLFIQFYDHGEICGKVPTFQYESVYMNNFKLIKSYKVSCDILHKTFAMLNVPESLRQNEDCLVSCRLEIKSKNVKSFFRPLAERQILKLLLNILEKFQEAMKNFSHSSSEFFRLFLERKLSSSRRMTLNKIVESFPDFQKGFGSLLDVVHDTFNSIQALEVDDENEHDDTIKFLKIVLKFSENLEKNFSIHSRNFFIANEKTCEFLVLTNERKCLQINEDK